MTPNRITNLSTLAVAVCGLLALAATRASAQAPAPERVIVSAGFGQQSAASAYSAERTLTVYAEDARFSERYGGRIGAAFDVAGAVRVWRHVWVGAAFAQSSYRASVDVQGDLPHPFRFAALRAIEGTKDGLERTESDVHVMLMYRLNLTDRFALSASVGPALISATQDVVDSVAYDEVYPYDTATFADARLTADSTSKITVGVGADISYRLFNRISVGVAARHARATVHFNSASGHSVRTTIGGTDLTGGVRFAF